MSNVYVYLARANTTLSVTLLTQATCLMAAVRIRTAGLTFTASGSRSR